MATGHPTTASGARGHRLQSRRFHHLRRPRWGLVEKFADELLEELLQSGAQQLFAACDECVEQVCDGELAISAAPLPKRSALAAA